MEITTLRLAERTDDATRGLTYLAAGGERATVADTAERFEVSNHRPVEVVRMLVEPARIRIGEPARLTSRPRCARDSFIETLSGTPLADQAAPRATPLRAVGERAKA